MHPGDYRRQELQLEMRYTMKRQNGDRPRFYRGLSPGGRQACEDWYRMHCNEAGEITGMRDGNVFCSVCG